MIALDAQDLGAQIRSARRAKGWSQQELADRVGTSRQWVVSVEKGAPTARIDLVLQALRWTGLVVDVVPESLGSPLDQITGSGQ